MTSLLVFFHGWRRKVGMAMLSMVCLLCVAWMRSYVVLDGILVPARQSQYGIVSINGGVKWERCAPVPLANRLPVSEWIRGAVTAAHRADFWSTLDIEWRRKWCGFDLGVATDAVSGVRFDFAVVPYWSAVLPLTLLSAYLMISKPKSKAQLFSGSFD